MLLPTVELAGLIPISYVAGPKLLCKYTGTGVGSALKLSPPLTIVGREAAETNDRILVELISSIIK